MSMRIKQFGRLALVAMVTTVMTASLSAGVAVADTSSQAGSFPAAGGELATTTVAATSEAPKATSATSSGAPAAAGAESTSAAAAKLTLTCTITVNNPHYSKGAPGVIAKIRYYNCVGNTTGVLSANGYLVKYKPGAVGPYAPSATNLGVTRNVSPGSEGTIYIPRDSEPGIACNSNHNYYGWASGTLTVGGAPGSFNATSATIQPNCP